MGKTIYHAKNDPKYQQPYIDLEEKRERRLPDGTVLPYLYVHGGFRDTNLKFAISYPEKDHFEGRFYQYLSPFPGPMKSSRRRERKARTTSSLFVCCMARISSRPTWRPARRRIRWGTIL